MICPPHGSQRMKNKASDMRWRLIEFSSLRRIFKVNVRRILALVRQIYIFRYTCSIQSSLHITSASPSTTNAYISSSLFQHYKGNQFQVFKLKLCSNSDLSVILKSRIGSCVVIAALRAHRNNCASCSRNPHPHYLPMVLLRV